MKHRVRGVALGIVLVLLLGLSLLAVAGLGGALAGLALSGFEQQSALAFRAAETAASRALASGASTPVLSRTWPAMPAGVLASAVVQRDAPGPDDAWAIGFSAGRAGPSFLRQHHIIRAEGRAERGTRVRIEQGFVVLAPWRGAAP